MTRALAIFTLLIFLVLATYVFISMRPVALPRALDPVANWFDERRSAPGDNTAPARAPEPTAPTVENLAARSAVAEVSVNGAGEVSVKPGSAQTSATPAIADARNAGPGTGPASESPAAAASASTSRATTAPAVVASADTQAKEPTESTVIAPSGTVAASEPASADRPAGAARAQGGSEPQVTTAAAGQASRPGTSARLSGSDATARMATAAAGTDARLAGSGQGGRADQATNQAGQTDIAGQTDNAARARESNTIVAQRAVRTAPAEANEQRGANQMASRSNTGEQGMAPLAAVSPAPNSPAPNSPATIGSSTTRVLGQTEEAPGAAQMPGNETQATPITTGSTQTLRQNAADATNALVARSVTPPPAARAAETPEQLAMAQPTREAQAMSAPSVRASVSTDAGLISPETRTPPPRTEQAVEQQQTIVNFLEGRVVEFEVGRDRLTTAGVKVLDRLVPLIQAHENTVITVQGHTDDVGDARSNLELSAARAVVARRYLISRGVDPKRLRAQGLGESQPLTTNLTAAGRIRNRRIDFAVSDIRDTP